MLKYENMKNKIIIFIKLMQKYSQAFSNITDNIFTSDKTKLLNADIEDKEKKELIKTINQFNKLLFNPKLSENIFQEDNNNINKNEKDSFEKENLLNNYEEENEKQDISKEDIKKLIEKYESKINILLSENDILKMNKDNQTKFRMI